MISQVLRAGITYFAEIIPDTPSSWPGWPRPSTSCFGADEQRKTFVVRSYGFGRDRPGAVLYGRRGATAVLAGVTCPLIINR